MTSGMTKEQTKDLSPRARAPPSQVPIMRRCRSLSELPGSVRVPILKRTDNERMRARLEAGIQGLEELKLLREQQQKQIEEVRNTALQKKSVTSQNGRVSQGQSQHNQRRMSAVSLRLSSQSLARINEEGDDNGGDLFSNGRLQDCTNLTRMGHRRHSSFSLEACRNRRPLSTTDTDVFENELSAEPEMLRKTQSWSALPYRSRSASSDSLNEGHRETPNQFANFQNNRRNQRSMSVCVVSSNSYNDHLRHRDDFHSANNENIEPKLRRASIQCDAVLTGSNKKNQGIFKDVDLSNISTDSPGPLHAVLQGFKANQCKPNDTVSSRVKRSGSFAGYQYARKSDSCSAGPAQRSETNLSPSDEQRCMAHRRTLSETDSTRLKKGASLPNNIHNLNGMTSVVNNYFQRHPSKDTQDVNGQHEKHSSVCNTQATCSVKSNEKYGSSNKVVVKSRENTPPNSNRKGQNPRPEMEARRRSEDNVFVEIQMCRTKGEEGEVQRKQNDKPTASNDKHRIEIDINGNTRDTSSNQNINRMDRNQQLGSYSPAHVSFHEKKFSIASDEGYVTSPPSTPRGRHAHSIVSDSSWISTDFDDTASSCDVSPIRASCDPGVKATTPQLKRSDLSRDYSKAKLSRRSSDYGSTSDCDGKEKNNDDTRKRVEEIKQELFRYDSCESLPFRQTAV